MKMLSLILTYALGKFASASGPSPSVQILEQLFSKARYFLLMTTFAFVFSVLFCSGVVLSIIDLSYQYDSFASMSLSATFFGGISLSLFSLICLGITLSKRTWSRMQTIQSSKSVGTSTKEHSPIQEALTLLVVDFIDERKARREGYRSNIKINSHYPQSNPQYNQDVVH